MDRLLCLCMALLQSALAYTNMLAKLATGARKSHRQYGMDGKRHESVDAGDAAGSVAGQCDLLRAAV